MPVAGRWPWRNVSRSRYADGQPGRLLDLEGELATGRPIGTRTATTSSAFARAESPGDALGPASSRARLRPGGPAIRPPSSGRPESCAPTAGRGEHRLDVADRVAPALVELARLDDDVGDCRRRAIGGSR